MTGRGMAGNVDPPQPELAKAEVLRFFQTDAVDIRSAREKASLIRRTKDIRASGNEVELAVRSVLRKRLPGGFRVGHGHVLDSRLQVSPEIDVIISDLSQAPILADSDDGTEYVPFESVYAIGEVKTSFIKSEKQIEAFTRTLARFDQDLVRDKTPRNYLGNGLALGSGLTFSDTRPYRNPLFSFMIFADGGDFDLEAVRELYSKTPSSQLPTVVCLLERSVLAAVRIGNAGASPSTLGPVSSSPSFEAKQNNEGAMRWAELVFEPPETRLGANLGFLLMVITAHLGSSVLMRPDLARYLGGLLPVKAGTAFADVA